MNGSDLNANTLWTPLLLLSRPPRPPVHGQFPVELWTALSNVSNPEGNTDDGQKRAEGGEGDKGGEGGFVVIFLSICRGGGRGVVSVGRVE